MKESKILFVFILVCKIGIIYSNSNIYYSDFNEECEVFNYNNDYNSNYYNNNNNNNNNNRDNNNRDINNRDFNQNTNFNYNNNDNYNSNRQRKVCDQSKGLYCQITSRNNNNYINGHCQCYSSGSEYIHGKCRAKIDSPCIISAGNNQQSNARNVKLECVKNAVCDTYISYFCRCRDGYEPSYDRSSCYYSHSTKINANNFIYVLLTSLVLFLIK